MFIGHYGVSYGLKTISPKVPLWVLLLGVQLIDVFFCTFLFFGVEKMRIVPGFITAFAIQALASYFLIAWWGGRVDNKRVFADQKK